MEGKYKLRTKTSKTPKDWITDTMTQSIFFRQICYRFYLGKEVGGRRENRKGKRGKEVNPVRARSKNFSGITDSILSRNERGKILDIF